jgi:predicted Zn-dependent protease
VAEEQPGFEGFASHPELGEEVSGRIFLDRWRLRFESTAVAVEIPLNQARLEITSGEDGAPVEVRFGHPEQPEWGVRTTDVSILEDRQLRGQAHTRNQIRIHLAAGDARRRIILTGIALAALALIVSLVTMGTGFMVRRLVARIPPSFEKQIGDEVIAELKTRMMFRADAEALARLDRGVAPLLDALPTNQVQFQFYVMEYPLPNAFALPGGHVVVTSALLNLTDRPEELAGVVAHEISHVTLKHGFRKIISSAGPLIVCKLFLGNGGGLLGHLGESSELLVRQSFSQEYELEADAQGFDYLVAAHIDPRGLSSILRKLQLEHDRMRVPHTELGAFASHPTTEKRLRRLDSKWKRLSDKSSFKPLQKLEEK